MIGSIVTIEITPFLYIHMAITIKVFDISNKKILVLKKKVQYQNNKKESTLGE